jgi:hypothetical protein
MDEVLMKGRIDMTARKTSTATETTASTRAPARRGQGNPGMLIIIGVLLLGFALLVITLQTQTNEAYINGTQHTEATIQAQWTIWLQIPKLIFGSAVPGPDVRPDELIGVIVGQGVELAYLGLVAGLEITMHTSQKMGRIAGIIITILLIIISIFDFYTDLVYGNVSPVVHVIFAVFCTFVIGFFPTWGLSLVEHGWKRL